MFDAESIMTLSIMTLNQTALCITALSIKALSIPVIMVKLRITTLNDAECFVLSVVHVEC
jgi:hypothetical protein